MSDKRAIIGLGIVGIGYGLNYVWQPNYKIPHCIVAGGLVCLVLGLLGSEDSARALGGADCPALTCPACPPCFMPPPCPVPEPCPPLSCPVPSPLSCPTPSPCPSPIICPAPIVCAPCPEKAAAKNILSGLATFGSVGNRVLDLE